MNVEALSKYAGMHAQTLLGEDAVLPIRCIQHSGHTLGASVWYETTSPISGIAGFSGLGSRIVLLDSSFCSAQAPIPVVSEIEKIRRDLERLKDGWNGDGSSAPSSEVLSDLDQVLAALPEGAATPEVEVDDDTGHITLRWQDNEGQQALSIVVSGTKQLLTVTTTLGEEPFATPRRIDASNGEAVARFLDREEANAKVLVHG
jgi:hypothetical protein